MLFKFEYATNEERSNVIVNNTDKYLIEEQNITEGNFLIFSDLPAETESPVSIEERILVETQYQTILLEMNSMF